MTDREKLVELIDNAADLCPNEIKVITDHLLANGVTFATDKNDGSKWRPASEPPKEPKEPMKYIVMIEGAANATALLFDGDLWFEEDSDGWRVYYHITHWMPLPEPPMEE